MSLLKKIIVSGFSSLVLVSAANAAYIDFGSSAFNGARNQESFTATVEGITVQVEALEPSWAVLTKNNSGLGINSGFFDGTQNEIGGNLLFTEVLEVEFLSGPVTLSQIDVANLYSTELWLGEVGIYTANNQRAQFTGSSNGNNSINVFFTDVSRITFSARTDLYSDFNLKGLEVSASSAEQVPEPGMISLLGFGVLAFSGFSFFRRKK